MQVGLDRASVLSNAQLSTFGQSLRSLSRTWVLFYFISFCFVFKKVQVQMMLLSFSLLTCLTDLLLIFF